MQKLARTEYQGATGSLLVVYGVEGFLRRLAASDYAAKMTLKGGMLMAVTATRRMTKDAAPLDGWDRKRSWSIARIVADIATVELADDDGLVFDIVTIRTEVMREQAEYHGVRVKIEARLATARPIVTLDFSFGDPHRSVIVDLPGLLGDSVRLASYPPELTLAEKIATMMSRRELDTRDRDFADVWTLSRPVTVGARTLQPAIVEVSPRSSRPKMPIPAQRGPGRDARAPSAVYGDALAHGLPASSAAIVDGAACRCA